MKKLKTALLIILSIFAFTTIITTIYLLKTSYSMYNQQKYLMTKDETIYPVKIYDCKGRFIDEISKNRKTYVTINDIPESLKKCFIAVEDRDFYKHNGINFHRIIGAMTTNVKKMEKDQGASTITQQMVKNVILKDFHKTYTRKIKEAVISLTIEKDFTKEQILQKYLNEVYYGNGVTGVKEAANSILGKELKDLNLLECAFIAGVPNNPTKYSPYKKLKNATERAKFILGLMKEQNLISETEYSEAIKETITTVHLNKKYNYPDITDFVKRELKNIDEGIYNSEVETYINTSFDIDFHNQNIKTLQNNSFMVNNPECQYSSVILNPQNGEIKSIIAGRDYEIDKFNRAVLMKRQIGSLFKPFLYFSEIINRGMTPLDIVVDEPVNINGWSPKNVDLKNYGSIVVDVALEKSINTIPAKLLYKSGFAEIKALISKINNKIVLPEVYSLALGTCEMSPLEVSELFAVFPSGGKQIKAHSILSIKKVDGKQIYAYKNIEKVLFDEVDTAIMTNMLRNVVTYGTANNAHLRGIDIGGKTGTADGNRSVWFSGFTEELLGVYYVGYDYSKDLGMTAGIIAAPLFKEYLLNLEKEKLYYPPERFGKIQKLVNERRAKFVFKDVGLKEEERINPMTLETEIVKVPRVREILVK